MWKLDLVAGYTVKSGYDLIATDFFVEDKDDGKLEVFDRLWKDQVPFQIKAFNQNTFLNRLASKDQLRRRGIFSSRREFCCVFCLQEEENLEHLFFICQVSKKIWKEVGMWIGVSMRLKEPFWKNFSSWWCSSFNKIKIRKGKEMVVWFTVL